MPGPTEADERANGRSPHTERRGVLNWLDVADVGAVAPFDGTAAAEDGTVASSGRVALEY